MSTNSIGGPAPLNQPPEHKRSIIKKLKKGTSHRIMRVCEPILRKFPTVSRITPPPFLHRETKGITVQTSMNDDEIANFNVVPKLPFDKHPLTEAQSDKANELINDPLISDEDKKCIMTMIHKCRHSNATRLDFRHDEWKALDIVNFELTKEHLSNLHLAFQNPIEDQNQNRWKLIGVNRKEALVAETLAKALAYTEGLDGKTIDIPVINEDGSSRLVEYKIELTVVGDNLPCYVLESDDENAPPWFVARGTEIVTGKKEGKEFRRGAKESILADIIDPNSVGSRAVIEATTRRPMLKSDSEIGKSINDYFKEWGNKKINLAGHSLGGYIVNDIAIRYSDNVKTSYGFSSPGLGKDLKKMYEKKEINEEKIVNFDIEGDVVPSSGRYYCGLHIATSNHGQDPLHTHLEHNLNNRNVNITKIDNEKENKKISRQISEGVRKTTGRVVKGYQRTKQLFTLNYNVPKWETRRRVFKELNSLQTSSRDSENLINE